MKTLIIVYDACVLDPAPLRSFLMYVAMTDLYRARWSDHEEWMRSVQRDYPGFTRAQGERIRDLMNTNVRDCLVTDYESLIETIALPDPDDRHVLAAAIRAGASVIVTFNLRDFPPSALQPYGIGAMHPDVFLAWQLELAPDVVCAAAKRQRVSLKNPPKSVEEYLGTLEAQGLPQTVAGLRRFAALL